MNSLLRTPCLLGFSIVVTFSCIHIASAQVIGPPSIAVGSGKVLMEKGKLDAELVASIVATKQDELKKEFAKRMLLDKVSKGNYLFWYSMKQNLELVFDESNPKVIQKELMRSAVELMTVVGMMEFYLASHRKSPQPGQTNVPYTSYIQAVVNDFTAAQKAKDLWRDLTMIAKTDPDTVIDVGEQAPKDESKKASFQEQLFNAVSMRQMQAGVYFPKPFELFQLSKLGDIQVTYQNEQRSLSLQNILLDMAYQVCSQDQYLQQLGLFQAYKEAPEKKFIDNCYILENSSLSDSSISANSLDSLKKHVKAFKEFFREDLEFLFRNSYRISKLLPHEVPSKNQLKDSLAVVIAREKKRAEAHRKDVTVDDRIVVSADTSGIFRYMKSIREDLKTMKITTVDPEVESSFIETLNEILRPDVLGNKRNDENVLYSIEQDLLPMLRKISLKNQADISKLITHVEDLGAGLSARTLKTLNQDYLKLGSTRRGSYLLYSKHIDRLQFTAIKILDLLDNLDKVDVYETAFKYIAELGSLIPDNSVSVLLNKVLEANERYAIVKKDSNVVRMDVESFYSYLMDTFASRNARNVTPYFSVGLNYNRLTNPDNELRATDQRSFAYVGEKLGVKVKILNIVKRRTFLTYCNTSLNNNSFKRTLTRTRPPMVDDVHILAFGSGLLYQIEEINTDKDFKSPQFGVGLGVSFFNNLDLNANLVFSNDIPCKRPFLNISFDIKFAEYLSELNKKRQERKLEKDE